MQDESGSPESEHDEFMDSWYDMLEDRDSPTDFDEYEMNPDDCSPDPVDPFDIEYDR